MEYITYKHFKAKAICGDVDIPIGAVCTEKDGIIYHDDKRLCLINSENAHQYFARNDDGNGLKRGEFITAIKETLALRDEHTDERWQRVLDAPICKQFNRGGDTWMWNLAFYNASIPYLEHIFALITENFDETKI